MPRPAAPFPRPEIMEALGTAAIVLFGGGAMAAAAHGVGPDGIGIAAVFGLTVAVFVAVGGPVSGAHYNPAITLAFAAVRVFPWTRVPAYLGAQLIGAVAAAAALAWLDPGAPSAAMARGAIGLPVAASFGVEAATTFLLAFVIIAVATNPRVLPAVAGAAIGAAVFIGSAAGGPWTGAGMNPARSLAPALVAGEPLSWTIYVLGPAFGAVFAMVTYGFLRPRLPAETAPTLVVGPASTSPLRRPSE